MKWILPLLTASTVVSGTALTTTAPQLNTETELSSMTYVLVEPEPIEVLSFAEFLADTRAKQIAIEEAEQRLEEAQLQARLDAIAAEQQRVEDLKNYKKLLKALKKTESYVDRTWYVFSGSTPQGWDCSGLVRWTYLQVGIELPHSATDQLYSGIFVDEPNIGDIVTFSFNGSTAGHAGIYIGNDTMIHSGGKKGDKTELKSISEFGKPYSKIFYTRIIQNQPSDSEALLLDIFDSMR